VCNCTWPACWLIGVAVGIYANLSQLEWLREHA
jgi:hypothetical protein